MIKSTTNKVPARTNSAVKTSPARNMAVAASKGSSVRGKESPVSFRKKG